MDNLLRQRPGKNGQPFHTQLTGWFESTISLQIIAKKAVDRTRDVASDRVNGFILTATGRKCPGVDGWNMTR